MVRDLLTILGAALLASKGVAKGKRGIHHMITETDQGKYHYVYGPYAQPVLTVEPGLYFQMNDLTVPEEYRGIGVRIEDDILVTATGSRNLSAALPRNPDEVEAWMDKLWSEDSPNLGL